MKLASIQMITDIRPIEGADRIEAATVLGYQTVSTQSNEYEAQEKHVYSCLRKWGFGIEARKHKSSLTRRKLH